MKLQHKAMLFGGLAGALIGVAAAFLYVKANEERIEAAEGGDDKALAKIAPGEALAIGLSIVALLRQIVGMGQPKK